MRAFANAYPEFAQQAAAQIRESILQVGLAKTEGKKILQQAAAKSGQNLIVQVPLAQPGKNSIVQSTVAQLEKKEIMQQVVAQIPWSHNVVLLDTIKDLAERIFYAQQTAEHGCLALSNIQAF